MDYFNTKKTLNTYSGNSHEDYLKHAENQILEFTVNMKKNKSKSKIELKKWIS
jgi:cephalosporin-C deacetylase-like acetyl esterase